MPYKEPPINVTVEEQKPETPIAFTEAEDDPFAKVQEAEAISYGDAEDDPFSNPFAEVEDEDRSFIDPFGNEYGIPTLDEANSDLESMIVAMRGAPTPAKEESVPIDEAGLIKRTLTDPPPTKPFWQSRKLGYVLLSIFGMVLSAVTGQTFFTPAEVVTFSLGIAGIGVGGHTVSDISHKRK